MLLLYYFAVSCFRYESELLMYSFLKVYYLFLLLIVFQPIYATGRQNPAQFHLQQLDNRSGLSNSAVNMVFQDNEELVWAGTWDGLNMYDGTDFRVFNYNSENQNSSIGSNVIQDIKEDKNGNIWLSTIGGITRFEKPTGKFYNYFYNPGIKSSSIEKEYLLNTDADGRVFCYSRTNGLSLFDPIENKFKQSGFPDRNNKIVKIECGTNGTVWLLNDHGQLLVSKFQRKYLASLKMINYKNKISKIFLVNHQIFITDNNDNLATVEANGTIRPIAGKFNGIKAISYYQNHYIIAWDNQGITTYTPDFKLSPFMQEEVKQLSGIRITSITPAKNNVLWIGTDGKGIIKIYPRINSFSLVNKANNYDLTKPVRAFCGVEKDLWIATKGHGILILANALYPGLEIKVSSVLNTITGLDNNAVYALKKGIEPYIYIGTDGKGLDVYDLKTKHLLKWDNIQGTQALPAFSSIYAIMQDRDSTLWLGTSGSGLIHLRLGKTKSGGVSVTFFKQYLSSAKSGPASDIIYSLTDGQDGRLWIACRYGGLSLLNKKTGLFKTFKASSYPNSLSNNDVLSLYKDKQKRLWIGTSYGLNVLYNEDSFKEKPVFRKYTMDDGLPNNTIHAIEEANTGGSIWLSTNKGLARLNPSTNAVANFRESDGLQSNEFSDGAVWKSPSGYIYFGGIYGFNYFLPERITENKIQPNLLVSRLLLAGKPIAENRIQVLKSTQGNVPSYLLERKNNFFQISLKSMSFFNPSKNEFAYKLEGMDNEWYYSGSTGNISYNNIAPGNYTLLVKWSNGEGVWTKGISVLKIHVEQYFWITYPALCLYLILIISAGYIFHLYRKNKLEMKYKLEMEFLLRKKDEDEHLQRLNFFTNIAHEIQTPLTLIMGSVEHFLQKKEIALFKSKENNYFLSILHQHTARLTYLVQQLLEFRKAEAGYLKKNDVYVDLSKMLDSLSALFNSESERNRKPYFRQIQPGIAGFIDKDKFEKILFNLLSNAFKHSAKEETIKFITSYNEETHLLEITVSNSGCKLKPEDLKHVFSKFYTHDEQSQEKFSTGIGLAFTKELVNLMNAEISIQLIDGWIHFHVTTHLETQLEKGKEEEVITSTPSYLYESLVKHHEQPDQLSAGEGNKHSLIDELQHRTEHSILLVEDESALRFMIRNILKDQYTVYEAGSGTEAQSFLKKTTPSLIISDVMMPDMNGLELCQHVKQTPVTAQIPFILLSARSTEENKAEGYEVGADAYIPKPFHSNYLLVRIRKLLDYQAKMRDLIKDQHISNQFMDTNIPDTDKKFLESLLKVIEINLNEPELNAAALEAALSISKMQLYRKLKSLTGMTPAEFIKRIRLKHAADMLRTSQYTVSEIFYRTGFNNKSYFFREFRKLYQCAPNDYRLRQYESNI